MSTPEDKKRDDKKRDDLTGAAPRPSPAGESPDTASPSAEAAASNGQDTAAEQEAATQQDTAGVDAASDAVQAAVTAAADKKAFSWPALVGIGITRVLWRMLGPAFFAATLVAWAHILGASDAIKAQVLLTAQYILVFAFLVTLAREILAPRNAKLRLVKLADHKAQRLFTIVRALLFVVLFTHWAIDLVEANEWSEAVAVLLRLLEQIGLIFFGWGALRRSGLLEKLVPENADSYLGVVTRLLVRVVLPLAVLTLLFYMVATALGYGALSRWVVRNAAWSAGYILIVGIVYRLILKQVRKTIAFMRDERVAEAEAAQTTTTPWYIGVERIVGGLLKILTAAAVVHGILTIWSVSWHDINSALDQPAVIGGGTWGDLVHGVSLILFAWLAYAFVRNLLIFMVFPRANVESGARYAMLTVLSYAAWTVIGVLAMKAIGADTSTLAVFAGGASVGLGFAMKDIFSNFFGGLIMLLERPVRVGDTIEVSGTKGKVEAIRLRGTLLRTFDGTTVMIPNTSMISTNLANLTHGFQTARMQIDVGVAYDENPALVEEILLRIAHADPRVVDDPEPAVRFNNFGASSLDFSLRIWTRDIDARWVMVSEMRHTIFEEFKKAGIEIPYNQMDLHLRSSQIPAAPGPVLVQQGEAAEASEEEEKPTAAKKV